MRHGAIYSCAEFIGTQSDRNARHRRPRRDGDMDDRQLSVSEHGGLRRGTMEPDALGGTDRAVCGGTAVRARSSPRGMQGVDTNERGLRAIPVLKFAVRRSFAARAFAAVVSASASAPIWLRLCV